MAKATEHARQLLARAGAELRLEVPLPIQGDKRTWDRVIRRPGIVIGFPIARKLALAVLQDGRDPGGNAIVLI